MGYAASLAMLMHKTGRERPDIEVGFFTIASSRLPTARNRLVESALNWGADAALLLDSDMTFPGDTLLRMLDHDLPVVAANCLTRDAAEPTAKDAGGQAFASTKDSPPLERMFWIGAAVMLVRAEALAKLQKPWFAFVGDTLGEDHFFCKRLHAAGVPLHIDHRLSMEVGHVAETVLVFPR